MLVLLAIYLVSANKLEQQILKHLDFVEQSKLLAMDQL
jgi:hypothetical protein